MFSEELYKGWSWSERFPAQPEIERWMHYVADRLDLRKDIVFNTTIKSAHFDEATKRWTITTDKGQVIDAQFLVTCCGMLSAPLTSLFPGQETFKGQLIYTARWPKEPVDFAGKRVGVVGIGATGIQVIQTIADKVGHLTVFVRTPQYVLPMKNPKYTPADQEAYKSKFNWLARATAAHIHRLRVRLREPVGRADARAAARGAGGDLGGRFAQVLDRIVRGNVLRPGGERTDLANSFARKCARG